MEFSGTGSTFHSLDMYLLYLIPRNYTSFINKPTKYIMYYYIVYIPLHVSSEISHLQRDTITKENRMAYLSQNI
jgi:hypothetical protein